jgi:hypothetical protein
MSYLVCMNVCAGLKMIFCNTTKNYTDSDQTLVISRPKFKSDLFFKPKAYDGQIIRDVDHWYINKWVPVRACWLYRAVNW